MIPAKPLPSRTYLRECFDYDLISGVATWRERPIEHFETNRAKGTWNSKFAWEKVGSKDNTGYLKTSLNGKQYLLHRLIWMWWYGTDPLRIDHRDRNRTNNRIINLRNVTNAINNQNASMRKDNTSGYIGVYADGYKWSARIQLYKKTIHIGTYDTPEEAADAIRGVKSL